MKQRLQAVADMVEPGSRLIDIGSDHLIIPNYLYDQGIASLVIASDVNPGPLASMRQNRGHRSIEIIRSDGLCQVDRVLDGAIIAGMGGRLIEQIIRDSLAKFLALRYLIVQPMQQIEGLRDFLQTYFEITQERLVAEDGKIYHVMQLVPGQDDYDSRLTKGLAPPDELLHFYASELMRWQALLECVPAEKKQAIRERIERLNQAKRDIIRYNQAE